MFWYHVHVTCVPVTVAVSALLVLGGAPRVYLNTGTPGLRGLRKTVRTEHCETTDSSKTFSSE